jgi:hypothetical protein
MIALLFLQWDTNQPEGAHVSQKRMGRRSRGKKMVEKIVRLNTSANAHAMLQQLRAKNGKRSERVNLNRLPRTRVFQQLHSFRVHRSRRLRGLERFFFSLCTVSFFFLLLLFRTMKIPPKTGHTHAIFPVRVTNFNSERI